jgi:hypothetical protein|tara:strand:- start:5552 stop:6388 length:837 start_codon:yes stop_codon:yes gene_type:complete
MILIDFTQTIIAGLMAQLKMNGGEMSEDMLRHMILNSVRNYQKKYSGDYGEITLCTDAANPWRRDFYPQYKANRKKSREADDKDWGMIFDTLHKVKMEIKENFPYRYMYVEKCEADDIIAVLTKHAKEDVLIVSGDKDFQQLHKYPYVTQWSPNLNKMIDCQDPDLFLREHILTGDKSDGVPNILSNDDCLDLGIRQTPLRKPIKDKYLRITIESDDKYYRNYLRNQTLIDLEFIPAEIEKNILEEFDKTEPVRGKVFDYLRTHRLDQLLNHVEDFTL